MYREHINNFFKLLFKQVQQFCRRLLVPFYKQRTLHSHQFTHTKCNRQKANKLPNKTWRSPLARRRCSSSPLRSSLRWDQRITICSPAKRWSAVVISNRVATCSSCSRTATLSFTMSTGQSGNRRQTIRVPAATLRCSPMEIQSYATETKTTNLSGRVTQLARTATIFLSFRKMGTLSSIVNKSLPPVPRSSSMLFSKFCRGADLLRTVLDRE